LNNKETKIPLVICGGQLKSVCGIVCDYTNSSLCDIEHLDESEEVSFYVKEDNGVVFCNPLFLDHVNQQIDLSDKILITHNTDSTLKSYVDGVATFEYLSGQMWSVPNLHPKKWLAQNSMVESVMSLPLGVTNNDIMEYDWDNVEKTTLVYKNFGTQNNPPERQLCDHYVNVPNEYGNVADRGRYYDRLKQSYFAVSPNGFGIDCHRHWEALYFNCIPIVTDNQVVRHFAKYFPMVIIDNWSAFRLEDYTIDLYQQLVSTFDRRHLDMNFFLSKTLNNETE
jgi:hypothetical protein